jgi:PAS domain S-box-containing protein
MSQPWYSLIADTEPEFEAKLGAVIAAMEDLLIIFDRDGRCLKIASAKPELLYIDANEQIGRTVYENIPFDQADLHFQAIQRTLATQETTIFEHCLVIDGRETWFFAKMAPLSADTVVMLSRDVTVLKQAEAELRSFFAAIPDVTLVYNNEGRCLKVLAPATPELFVAPPDVLVGKTLHEVLPLDLADLEMGYIRQCLATQRMITNIEYSLRLHGNDRWFTATVSPISANTVIWTARDITDRRQAEAALQQSEQRNRAILEAIPDLMFRVNQEGYYLGYLRANTLTNMVLEEVDPTGLHLSDTIPPEVAQRHMNAIHRALATRQLQSYEQEILIDGQLQYEEVRVIASGFDEVLFMIRNISDRKQAAAALQQSEQRNRAILEAIPDLMYRVSREGNYLGYVKTNSLVDLVPEELNPVGRHISETLPPELVHRHLNAVQQALSTGQLQSYEQEVMVNGQLQYEEVRVIASGSDEVLFMIRNISDRKQAEAALHLSEERNRAILEAIPDLMYRVSREGKYLGYVKTNSLIDLVPEEFNPVGHHISETLPPELVQRHLTAVQQALSTRQLQSYEQEVLVNSQLQYEEVRVVASGADEVLFMIRNISDRKQAEAALQVSLGELAAANQEITLLNQRLQSENLRMSAELAIARQLQQLVLPKEQELQQVPGLDIAGFMQPTDEVGGDYYDVLQHDGHLKISIGDVTGHGLESGVLMLMTQTAVRTLLEHQETDLTRFLTTLNRVIYNNAQRMNCHKNLTLTLLDYERGRLRLSGQHEEVLVVRAGGEIERLDTTNLGFPLGLVIDIQEFISHVEVQLKPGDGVVLYTDGITDAINFDRQRYGLERLCRVIRQHWDQSAEAIRQQVVEDIRSHIGEHKIQDDLTLLIVKQR